MPSDEHAAREALRASLAATGARSNRSAVTLFTWWLGALSPRGPYAPLIIRGSCGTGKTVLGRLAIRMIDPHRAEMQRMPSLEDLPIAIKASHAWGFDNLSRIDQEHSDAVAVFEASKPVLLTGSTDAEGLRPLEGLKPFPTEGLRVWQSTEPKRTPQGGGS